MGFQGIFSLIILFHGHLTYYNIIGKFIVRLRKLRQHCNGRAMSFGITYISSNLDHIIYLLVSLCKLLTSLSLSFLIYKIEVTFLKRLFFFPSGNLSDVCLPVHDRKSECVAVTLFIF